MEALEFMKEAQRMCEANHCVDCPAKNKCVYVNHHSEDKLEEIVSEVEQWSKEHPLVTNKMRIREVFGDEAIYAISSPNVQALKDWLDEPYKEPEHDL